jgi:hypothetical protein
VTRLIGYRIGWAEAQPASAETADPWPGSGRGPFHAVPEGSEVAICGTRCVRFDGQPFAAQPGHCRECVRALRVRAHL